MLLHRHAFVGALNLLLFFLISDFEFFCFALFNGHLQNIEGVLDQVRLDLLIRLRVRIEAGRVVDLQHPRFQFLVQHNVKAQKFKATVRLFLLA